MLRINNHIKKLRRHKYYLIIREKIFKIDRFSDIKKRDFKMMKEARKRKLIPHLNIKHPAIWIKQKGKCYYCEVKLHYPRNRSNKVHINRQDLATLDHFIPKFFGGSREEGNQVYACNKCNQEKGYKIWDSQSVQKS